MATRQHNRGPHPADAGLFDRQHVPTLVEATGNLSWLLSRGYAPTSSLKLVGDRFDLVARQRTAVMRSACSDRAMESRSSRAIPIAEISGSNVEIDTLNLLITLEAALAGGVVLRGRDGTYRDMASIHGSYRKVDQTRDAISLVGQFFRQHAVAQVLWRIDRPVSNSGRLRAMLLEFAAEHDFAWEVRLDDDPDRVLGEVHDLVVTADAAVLDRVKYWANLARWMIDQDVSDAWIVPMSNHSID